MMLSGATAAFTLGSWTHEFFLLGTQHGVQDCDRCVYCNLEDGTVSLKSTTFELVLHQVISLC